MLNDMDVKMLFENKEKIDRAIVTQTETKYCKSFIRNKLILRYNFELAILLVRDEITHKITAERPLLVQNAITELCELRSNIEKINVSYFVSKTLSDIIPNYMLLLNYVGIPTKKSKICLKIKNYLTIVNKYNKQQISEELLKNESEVQLTSLERKINIYTRGAPADVIIFMLRYDIKK